MTYPCVTGEHTHYTETAWRRCSRHAEAQAKRARRRAAEIGREHGDNAASWWEQDAVGGRVAAVPAHDTARRVLRGLEDGDPAILEALPAPDLSGEWADGYTPDQLAEECGLGPYPEDRPEVVWQGWLALREELCDVYENAFIDAATAAVVVACKGVLP